jgi:hypothetical protein
MSFLLPARASFLSFRLFGFLKTLSRKNRRSIAAKKKIREKGEKGDTVASASSVDLAFACFMHFVCFAQDADEIC